MSPRTRSLFRHEAVGAAVIVLAGSALHFVYAWTGNWPPAALIAAVNESIWEHLKLAFWPGLLWALLPVPGAALRDRLAARGLSLTLTALLIVTIFTSYTAILGDNLLALDIGTFALAVLAGQIAAALLLIRCPRGTAQAIGLGLLTVQMLAYGLFTYYPPDHWLFIDSRNGLSGLAAS